MLQLGLLARLLELWLLFDAKAWTAVAVSSCGSALRADFFFKQRSRLLKLGLLGVLQLELLLIKFLMEMSPGTSTPPKLKSNNF